MSKPDAFPSSETWYPHRVSYGETDTMGVAYYGEYMHFFERSRSEYIRARGMSYAEVEARGVLLPVREAYCRYRKSAHYDDLIWIRVGVSEWGRASMTFVYEVRSEDRAHVLATGHTQHACVGPEGKPVAVPGWLRDLFS
ncbi:MAG: acyl-CoA thioesterase [Desulfovibrionaceae bacterium]